MVKTKLDAQDYQTLKEVVADIGQIFNNAKRCKSSMRRPCTVFDMGCR